MGEVQLTVVKKIGRRPRAAQLFKKCQCSDTITKTCSSTCTNRWVYTECNANNCPHGENDCGNRRSIHSYLTSCFPRETKPSESIFDTSNWKGIELAAVEHIPKDAFIGQYVGEIMEKPTDEFYDADVYDPFTVEKEKEDKPVCVIDATNKANLTRFINHSCDPNSEMQTWIINNE